MVHRQIALLLLAISLILGCTKKDYKSGEAVYEGECAKCHKLNGSGGTKGPDLTNIFEKHDEQYIRDYTQDPRSIKADSVMPPAKIDDKQFEMLIDYLRKSARKHASLDPNHSDQR
ncbi:MAG TPA: cytochrome c [Acidobacteriota bacterium]|jgi:mono/diheme cytochrome c family protein